MFRTGADVRTERVDSVDEVLREQLLRCWVDVTNAGGAVGFVPPVVDADVAPVLDELVVRVSSGAALLCVLRLDGRAAGFATIALNRNPLLRHWGHVYRVQVHPDLQGRGLGTVLLQAVHRVAADAGLEMLVLSVRGGTGREDFYRRLGYQEYGRLPGEVRVSPGDDREGIYLYVQLAPQLATSRA